MAGLGFTLILLLSGCRLEPAFERLESRVSFGDVVIEHLGEQWQGDRSHTVDPGNGNNDVFVIVSNPRGDERGAATVHVPELEGAQTGSTSGSSRTKNRDEMAAKTTPVSNPEGVRNPLRASGLIPRAADLPPLSATGDGTATAQTDYSEGKEKTFHGLTELSSATRNPFDAVLKRRESHNDTTLNVWVEKDIYSGDSETYSKVADTIAEAFFKDDGAGNPGIFEISTTLFGDFWGSNDRSAVIGNTDTVDVVLFNIGSTDSPTNGFGQTVLGYFDPRDLYRTSVIDNSAERAMVYLHGPAFAEADDSDWEATDLWPAEMLLTVAHEFQHLINFYEKRVRRGVPVDTWLDELMSLQAEELTASLLRHHAVFGGGSGDGSDSGSHTAGILRSPRGLPADCARADPNADPNNGECAIDTTFARTRAYNTGDNHARSLTAWDDQEVRYRYSGAIVDADYATSYLFGAWLTRNFGLRGEFFSGLNDNVSGGRDAVTGAVRESARAKGLDRRDYSFGQLLDLWKSALVLSDLSVAGDNLPVPYRMSKAPPETNSGSDFFEFRPGGPGESWPESMLLGSVDIWAYGRAGQGGTGPNYGTLDSDGRWKSPGNRMEAVSAQVVHIRSPEKPITINYSVPPGASVTVITRPALQSE